MDERRVECGDVADDDVDGAVRDGLRAWEWWGRVAEMVARLTAMVLLLSVILMGTVNPAEACVIWCLGSNGMQKHAPAASGMAGHHHHAGMTGKRPVRLSAGMCGTNCSAPLVARVEESLVSQRTVSSDWNPLLRDRAVETAERDGGAVVHFEVAGPPGLVKLVTSIRRI